MLTLVERLFDSIVETGTGMRVKRLVLIPGDVKPVDKKPSNIQVGAVGVITMCLPVFIIIGWDITKLWRWLSNRK